MLSFERLQPGVPYPLGASWDGSGTNFAVFSAHAEKIELCLFDTAGKHEIARLILPSCTDEVWHGYLPDCKLGQIYGYRAHGPYEPERGHRFNPTKLLLDPYTRQLFGQARWSDALYGYRVHSSKADLTIDRRDSAAGMPKSIVTDEAFNWGDDRAPNIPWSKTVIYEAHVRGLTMLRSDIRPKERGTFAALANPRVIDHLVKLGITALELLPIHAILHDRFLVEKGLRNYWGYNTLAFFAPEPRYLSDGSTNEIRTAVRRLHAAGIEVILDVVYNHTCEGSELGPTVSWRGLDNASYYRLLPNAPRYHINDTGCGNTVNMSNPRVIQMVMDSLRHWVQSYRIDGFRFDLGVTLGREAEGFDPGAGFFDALRQDPVLSKVKLIFEPWDVGPGGYQVGGHPAGFTEWNGKYRDDVRRFWNGDAGMRAPLASRLHGSADLFDHHKRRPWASLNFVTSHDGYTLHDLVSYNAKHNEANGEDNRDGDNTNHSYNWGAEGVTDDAGINEQRERVKRALLATLLFSTGTPMLTAGDEFGRTQNGNNNAYCQDNEVSWIDWSLPGSEKGRALLEYTRRLIRIRRENPALRPSYFQHGVLKPAPGIHDIDWFDEQGKPMSMDAWGYGDGRALTVRRAVTTENGKADVMLMLVNGSNFNLIFKLPAPSLPWQLLVDSFDPEALSLDLSQESIEIRAHSTVLLIAKDIDGGAE